MPELGINMPIMGMHAKTVKSREKGSKPAQAKAAKPKASGGARSTTPSDALFTRTQQRVLGLLFGTPARSYYATELIALAGSGSGAVQRELARLCESGLIMVSSVGNQRHYQANPAAPAAPELAALIQKLAGRAKASASGKRYGDATSASAITLHSPAVAYATDVASTAKSPPLRIPRARLAALCKKYGIKKLSLFGSAARNEMTPESDVDLMVEFDIEKAPPLWDLPNIQSEFSAILGNRRVDLVPPSVMRNPYRRKTIEPDLKVLYEAT